MNRSEEAVGETLPAHFLQQIQVMSTCVDTCSWCVPDYDKRWTVPRAAIAEGLSSVLPY